MEMKDWNEDTRIHKYDPIIPHLQSAWKFWVEGGHADIVGPDEVFDHAKGDLSREQFTVTSKAVTVDSWSEFAWDVAPWGESPGGHPFASTSLRIAETYAPAPGRHGANFVRDENNHFVDHEFYIRYGLCENYNPDGTMGEGDRWYVDMTDENENDITDFVYIPMAEATPSVILGWVRLFRDVARERTVRPYADDPYVSPGGPRKPSPL